MESESIRSRALVAARQSAEAASRSADPAESARLWAESDRLIALADLARVDPAAAASRI